MTALLVTTDLMATSAADGAAAQAGVRLQTVAPNAAAGAADETTRFVALDLTAKVADLPGWIAAVRESAPQATLLAYGPHVHEAKLNMARESGFDHVVSRGHFYKQMTELLKAYASPAG
ncbi:hypothetical protein Pla108_03220 [Botrimarina colliarenosi]|uniref:Response regulatory domain-containing protein n=1 Tax=Botrimarina colliarenosi TaxID=2528001 RepID=A0A5C6AJN3_9BACT|nr:hypothetical protein [Botrimarina colliarenosi]TWT99385.1 hypothetical protein Pla108_03220 [Botrimarina colliarenosi]